MFGPFSGNKSRERTRPPTAQRSDREDDGICVLKWHCSPIPNTLRNPPPPQQKLFTLSLSYSPSQNAKNQRWGRVKEREISISEPFYIVWILPVARRLRVPIICYLHCDLCFRILNFPSAVCCAVIPPCRGGNKILSSSSWGGLMKRGEMEMRFFPFRSLSFALFTRCIIEGGGRAALWINLPLV